ncbi:MAG TPA: hypothetical protein VE224_14335 [Pseudolabrys sp.]|nr:hypothetical protein [Pseudolabrys sp.]
MYAVVWAIDQDKIAYWAGGNHFSEEAEDAVRFPNKTLAEGTIPLIYPRGMHNPGAFVTDLQDKCKHPRKTADVLIA